MEGRKTEKGQMESRDTGEETNGQGIYKKGKYREER